MPNIQANGKTFCERRKNVAYAALPNQSERNGRNAGTLNVSSVHITERMDTPASTPTRPRRDTHHKQVTVASFSGTIPRPRPRVRSYRPTTEAKNLPRHLTKTLPHHSR